MNESWRAVDSLTDEAGGWVRLELRDGGQLREKTRNDPWDGHWRVAPATNAQAHTHGAVRIANPWCGQRIVTASEAACAFALLARAPRDAMERRLAQWLAGSGLWERAVHGIGRSAPRPNELWTAEDAHWWASTTLEGWGGSRRGEAWRGAGPAPLPRPEWDTDAGADIELEMGDDMPRAIAESARWFSGAAVTKRQLGRWLARFARVRTQRTERVRGDVWTTATRGAPEGGALGALGATLAIERCRELEAGLYDYAPKTHRLRRRDGSATPFVTSAERSMGFACARPAGVLIISCDMRRMTAKYERIALSAAMLNAGVWVAAAYAAGEKEGIAVRALGKTNGEEWERSARRPIAEQAPIASVAFGIEGTD